MDDLDRPTIQRSAADLADEVKLRSAHGAAVTGIDLGEAALAVLETSTSSILGRFASSQSRHWPKT